jgi:hypothetical protein
MSNYIIPPSVNAAFHQHGDVFYNALLSLMEKRFPQYSNRDDVIQAFSKLLDRPYKSTAALFQHHTPLHLDLLSRMLEKLAERSPFQTSETTTLQTLAESSGYGDTILFKIIEGIQQSRPMSARLNDMDETLKTFHQESDAYEQFEGWFEDRLKNSSGDAATAFFQLAGTTDTNLKGILLKTGGQKHATFQRLQRTLDALNCITHITDAEWNELDRILPLNMREWIPNPLARIDLSLFPLAVEEQHPLLALVTTWQEEADFSVNDCKGVQSVIRRANQGERLFADEVLTLYACAEQAYRDANLEPPDALEVLKAAVNER